MTYEQEEALWASARDDFSVRHAMQSHRREDVDGPLLVNGVAYFTVRKLPEPGWRVVVPFETRDGAVMIAPVHATYEISSA